MEIKCYLYYTLNKYVFTRDFILSPIYIFIFYLIVSKIKNKLIFNESPLKDYLIKALFLKMSGAIIADLVYQYFYGGGDSTWYFASASNVYSAFYRNPLDGMRLIWYDDPSSVHPYLMFIPECFVFIHDTRAWMVIRIASVFNLLALDSYFVSSLFFSMVSLYASWKFFKLITTLYPALVEKSFYAIFCVPSVFFWGSGIFKDTIMLSALLLTTYHFYYLVINPSKEKLVHIVWLFVCFYFTSKIRMFFVGVLAPCLLLWYMISRLDKVRNQLVKSILFPLIIIGSFAAIFVYIGSKGQEEGSELNTETLKAQTETIQDWHTQVGGSSYSLGINDYSTLSMIKVFPLAVNVSLFRPYLWETHTFFQLIIALQSLFYLLYTVSTLRKIGIGKFFSSLAQEPMVFFFFLFSILFSFICGFTSYNFGALDRYKIPVLTFYILSLIIVRHNHEKKYKNLG